MATHARGLVCLALPPERDAAARHPAHAGRIGPAHDTSPYGASIEARRGVSTGISAADRATTIRAAVGRAQRAGRPRHAGTRDADPGRAGRRARAARSREAASDLVRLAGARPAAAVCAVLGRDGNLARGDAPARRSRASTGCAGVASTAVDPAAAALRAARRRLAEARARSASAARFRAIVYDNTGRRHQHMALVPGDCSAASRSSSGCTRSA